MVIRFAKKDEYAEVLMHYEICNYNGVVQDDDQVIVAVDQQIVGAVRICEEHGVKVLRGMQVKPSWQNQCIGYSILKYLANHIDMKGCYCLPYEHLRKFYSLIGFEEILPQEAPSFLAERLKKYLDTSSRDIVIMMINDLPGQSK
jgi:N-acetylglutamate synthase-like GNAT family acetyltransferase